MIERTLPAGVAVAEAFGDPPEARLLPAEEAVIARAVERRRREFTTVRWCARRALGTLGVEPKPLLPGERGAPQWPAGVVGSMTHCDGYRAAAVARNVEMRTLGIDAEPHGPLPDGVLDVIALPQERRRLRRLGRVVPGIHLDRLLFSAKESVYKACFPITRCWMDCTDADIILRSDGTFTARILVPTTPADELSGRWEVGRGLLVTAIALAPGGERRVRAARPSNSRR